MALASHTAEPATRGLEQSHHGAEVSLYWQGEQDLAWHNLAPRLLCLKWELPHPDVLIIHLQVKEISSRTTEGLVRSIKNNLISVSDIFPQSLIVWSDILNEPTSRQGTVGDVAKAGDKFHDVINGRIHAVVAKLGGVSVSHDNIGPELYRRHGKQLSSQGVEMFKTNIHDFVDKWAKDVPHKPQYPRAKLLKV